MSLHFPQICQALGSSSLLLQPTDLGQGHPGHLLLLQRFLPPRLFQLPGCNRAILQQRGLLPAKRKRKWPTEFDPANPSVVNPESLMVVSWGAAREAQAEHEQLERLTEIAATQSGVEKGYTPDAGIVEAVKRLPGYLQPVVTLMATMVLLSEESKMPEKRGWEALAQATSMMLMVSMINLYQVSADHFYF